MLHVKNILAAGCVGAVAMHATGGDVCEPELISTIQLLSGSVADVTMNDHLGVVAQESGEIAIFDLSEGRLDLIAKFDRPEVREIDMHGDYLFASYENGLSLEIISLADPHSAMTVAELGFDDEVYDFEISDGVLYVGAGSDGARSYDISDPTVPFQTGMVTDGDVNHLSVHGDRVLVDEVVDGNRVGRIYNYTNPMGPVLERDSLFRDLYLFEEVTVLNYGAGYSVYDDQLSTVGGSYSSYGTWSGFEKDGDDLWYAVSVGGDQQPPYLSLNGRNFGPSSPNGTSLGSTDVIVGSAGGYRVALADGLALMTGRSGSVWLLDTGTRTKLDYQPSGVTDMAAFDDTLLIMSGHGFVQYEVSDKANPQRVGAVHMTGMNGRFYRRLADADGFLAVSIDVDDGFIFPSTFSLIDKETLEFIPATSADYSGYRQYVAASNRRFIFEHNFGEPGFYELDELNQYTALGHTTGIDFGFQVEMIGDVLVTLGFTGDLSVHDLSVPASISVAGELIDATSSNEVMTMITQDLVAVSGDGEVMVFDISDPGAIELVYTFDLDGVYSRKIRGVDGSLIIIRGAAGTSGTAYELYDMSDPAAPQLVEQVVLPGSSVSARLVGDLRYLRHDGELLIMESSCAAVCVADFNGDGALSFEDVSVFIEAYNASDSVADLNSDGAFNFYDVSSFVSSYLAGCP